MKKSLFLVIPMAICGIHLHVSAQSFSPVPVTGFDHDVVAEDSPAMSYTDTVLDGSDYILYSENYGNIYGSGAGLPDNGTITNGNYHYQLQPYDQANGMVLGTGQTDSLELLTPAAYSSLSLLGFSTEGSGVLLVVVLFTDGSGTVYPNLSLPDWFYNPGEVTSGFDRAGRFTGDPDYQFGEPRMYPVNILLSCADQQKLVKKLLVINTTSSPVIKTCVFGLSGSPLLNAAINTTIQPACYGDHNGVATVTATAGTPSYTYAWSTSPVQTATTAINLAPGNYTCVVTDANGCTDTAAVTIIAPPLITASQSITACNNPGYTIGTHTYTSSGNYVDTLTTPAGCDSIVTTNLTINTVDNTTSVAGATITAAASGAAYQWLDCNNGFAPVAGATSSSYTATTNGSYAVAVTKNGCTDTSACVTISILGMDENAGAGNIKVYPNPATTEIFITGPVEISQVEIFDLTGKKYQSAFQAGRLDISGLHTGIYMVRITTGTGEHMVTRLVKK